MTQTIEIKDFTGGENNIVDPFSVYPTEAQTMKNISVSSTGMKTKNLKLVQMIIPPRLPTTTYNITHNGDNVVYNGDNLIHTREIVGSPIQVAPETGNIYDMSFSDDSYYEKIRFYQGKNFIINTGIVYEMGANNTLVSTQVDQTLVATATQNATLAVPDLELTTVVQYTYYVSYRNSSGYESPLEEIGTVNAHVTFSDNYTVETASEQAIVTTFPADGDYGRIYRMGHNISFPSLVFQFDHVGDVTLNKVPVNLATDTFTFQALDNEVGEYGMTWGGVYPTSPLKYLTATKYGLAASSGSQVYLSMNTPDAWSALGSLNFGSVVTGIASVHRGFIVFTESTYLYAVTGSSLGNLRVDLISTDVGCSSNSSIAEVGEHMLIWIYKTKFYSSNGSTVNELEANTYYYEFFRKYGNDKDVTGVSVNNQYYVGYDEGVIGIDLTQNYKPFIQFTLPTAYTDPGYSGLVREFLHDHSRVIGVYHSDGSFHRIEEVTYSEVGYVDNYPPTDGWAMGCYTTDVVCEEDFTTCLELGGFGGYNMSTIEQTCDDGGVIGRYPEYGDESAGLAVSYKSEYLSPKFSFGDVASQATWSSVEVLFEGELDVFVFVDDVEVITNEGNFISSSKTVARVLLPNEQSRGINIEVKLRFNGAIYGFRMNGEPLYQMSK